MIPERTTVFPSASTVPVLAGFSRRRALGSVSEGEPACRMALPPKESDPVPKAFVVPTLRVPALSRVPPLNELLPVKVRTVAAFVELIVREPAPLKFPEYVPEFVSLKTNDALLVMLP